MKKIIILLLVSMITSVFYAQNASEIEKAQNLNDLVKKNIPALEGKDYFIFRIRYDKIVIVSKINNVYTYYQLELAPSLIYNPKPDVISAIKTLKSHPILEKIFTNFVPKAGVKRYSSDYNPILTSAIMCPTYIDFAIYKNGIKSFETSLPLAPGTREDYMGSPIPDEIHVFLFADLYGYNAEGISTETKPSVAGTLPKDHCTQIKTILNFDPDIPNSLKANLNGLKEKVNAPVNAIENGFEIEKEMVYPENYRYNFTPMPSVGAYSIEFKTGIHSVGTAHSHPSTEYAMFTFQDVRSLIAIYDKSLNKSEVFVALVCKDKSGVTNTYMLKIDYIYDGNGDLGDNIGGLKAQVNAVWDHPDYAKYTDEEKIEAIHQKQAKIYDKSNGQLEKSFLEQYKDFGISLYKADAELNNFSKLTLNNGVVTSTPCD